MDLGTRSLEDVVSIGDWSGRRVLVTGHTGFKGAWLALWLRRLGADVIGFSLPPEHADGTWSCVARGVGVREVVGDLCDAAAVRAAIEEARPDAVLHLGAQALVRRSYIDPVGTYETNVIGTANVLSASSDVSSVRAVVVVTTDKVYADTARPGGCVEDDPLGGSDPYSASKACAELLVRSWRASFGLGPTCVTARAGNVVGGGDRGVDRLVPDALRAWDEGRAVCLRSPLAIRPWQFVLEPLSGYLTYADRILAGADVPVALNFGPDKATVAITVAEVVDTLIDLRGGGRWEVDGSEQPPEALTLTLDSSRAAETLGWRARSGVREALGWTLRWHEAQRRGEDLVALSLATIDEFTDRQPA